MKKILIFTDSFLPGFKGGGPITSVANLVGLIHQDFEILIATKNHDFGEREPFEGVVFDSITQYEKFHVIYLSSIDFKSVSRIITEFNPDVLYLNSFFSKTTQIVMFLNKIIFKKKLVLAPRGELQENALGIKRAKKSMYLFLYKLFALYKNISFHSTDSIETQRIKKLFHTTDITQLQNGVKIHHYEPLTKEKNQLKIIFVSRISKKKNLLFALNLLSSLSQNILFDIFGPIEDSHYWAECESIIENLPKNIKVSYKGALHQNEIVPKMREYHTFLFPTLSENFGHVIVEAMQAGLVPIISDQTPWLNLESENAGWDISLDDEKKYINTIQKLYLMDNEEYTKISFDIMAYIQNKLNMKKLSVEYIDFFNKV